MNRMFFGDTRDLFKFDLVRHIMKAIPAFESFCFIPMLTRADVGTAQKKANQKRDLGKAKKSGKAGTQNRELVAQMERIQEVEDDFEYFQQIHGYFKNERIIVHVVSEQPFSHQGRSRYFAQIMPKIPPKSLIFLDPDIGLEETKPTEKHILFEEIRRITDRMDSRSALMIYQHFPRIKHEGYVHNRCLQLKELTGTDPLTITDNEILFFILAKNPKLIAEMEEVLERYANSYPALTSCIGAE